MEQYLWQRQLTACVCTIWLLLLCKQWNIQQQHSLVHLHLVLLKLLKGCFSQFWLRLPWRHHWAEQVLKVWVESNLITERLSPVRLSEVNQWRFRSSVLFLNIFTCVTEPVRAQQPCPGFGNGFGFTAGKQNLVFWEHMKEWKAFLTYWDVILQENCILHSCLKNPRLRLSKWFQLKSKIILVMIFFCQIF